MTDIPDRNQISFTGSGLEIYNFHIAVVILCVPFFLQGDQLIGIGECGTL